MKLRIAILVLLSVLITHHSALSADTVAPQSYDGGKLYRNASSIEYSTNAYYAQGASFLFTNLTVYSTAYSTNATAQGLSGVTVEIAWAATSSATGSVWTAATVQNASAGTVCCLKTNMPASVDVYWQLRLTDASTNVTYYTPEKLHTIPHL